MPPSRTPEKPPRGALLSVLLALITLGAVVGIGGTLVALSAVKKLAAASGDLGSDGPRLKNLLLFVLLASLLQLACAAGMWMWKRWGVIGYLGLTILSLLISSKIGPHGQVPYSDVIRILLLLGAALPKWSSFD
ncbi:MAG: hypothetical protein KF819_27860 [Labilithrix sp.]|nr:hypothetical protein [Labilithrix sp.]